MPAFYEHANSMEWWDGPDRFKRINRAEVAVIQTESILTLLDSLISGKKLDVGGPTPPHIPPSSTHGHTASLSNFVTCNIAKRSYVSLLGDGCVLPFKTNSFSLVFSSHAIEHIYDANKFISECDRVLKPCGFLFIICPDRIVNIHNCNSEKPGERSYEEFAPDELLIKIRTILPQYELLQFNSRNNNFDFEIFMKKLREKKEN